VTSGGITQARARLGSGPLEELFRQVAVPVADRLTPGAWLGSWRLMAVDGCEWDAPDSPANAAEFGYPGGGSRRGALPKVRMVTVAECGSHAIVDAQIGGSAVVSEHELVRRLYPRLEPGWLVLADRNFFNFADWQAAAATGAQLLWRVRSGIELPVISTLPDGSYLSQFADPKRVKTPDRRGRLAQAARDGRDIEPGLVVPLRVIEYTVADRGRQPGERIRLVTTILDPAAAPAGVLAQAYHERWEAETGFDQVKTHLRGPGRVLRSRSPDMILQEIYGYLLAHHAISALICKAATEAGIDPDRVKFLRTVRIVRRTMADPAAFSP